MLGAGTQANPYLISSATDLDSVRNNLTAYYELANDIDMSGWGNFIPISKSTTTYFKGSFDGKGFKIKNLTINETIGYVGLFGYINNSSTVIKNVGLENCYISGSNVANWVGSICGQLSNGSIQNCYSTGQIVGKYMVGGIVGQFASGSIKNCYSTANITGFARVGGLVGFIGSSTATIDKCYSTGVTTSTEVGTAYPAGGLIGDNASTINVTDSFWDIQTSGLNISEGGIGKTTNEMKTQSTYTNWDFSTIWGINNDYPYLLVFGIPVAPPKSETILVNSFSNQLHSIVNKNAQLTRTTKTFLESIQSNSERFSVVLRTPSTYLSQIYSTANMNARVVRSGNRNIETFINPLGSFLYRESKTVKTLLSSIKPIGSNISVLYPLNTIMPNAHLYIAENSSRAFIMDNISSVSYIINPSYTEVRK